MPNDERNLETIPDGALGLIPLESCKELGIKVDKYLASWREKRQHQHGCHGSGTPFDFCHKYI